MPLPNPSTDAAARVLFARHSPADRNRYGECTSAGYEVDTSRRVGWVRVQHLLPPVDLLDDDRPSDDERAAARHEAVDAYAATLREEGWDVDLATGTRRRPYLLAKPPTPVKDTRVRTLTPDTIHDYLRELASQGDRLATDLTYVDAESRARVASARIATTLWAQVRDAMSARAPWLRDRDQVAALLEAAHAAALAAGTERLDPDVLAGLVVDWMREQPTKLLVAVSAFGEKDEGHVPLPDDWWQMTKDERQEWSEGALRVHVENTVDAWWSVVNDQGGEVPVELDAARGPDDKEGDWEDCL
ncbi:hypothetical protein [Streptomyces sp. MN6]